MEGCLVDPLGIHWDHIGDEEIVSLRHSLAETLKNGDHEHRYRLATVWLPVHAYLTGIFKPKIIRLKDEFKTFVTDFQRLEKRSLKEDDPSLKAALFFRAIVLCDNEVSLRLIKGMDFAEIRARMRAIDPQLFSAYLELIKRRQQGVKQRR